MSAAQQRWARVEKPGTHRGHALIATFGKTRWTTWENSNGTWTLQEGTAPPRIVADFAEARRRAEAATANPLDVLLAKSASIGASMGRRINPQDVDTRMRLVEARARVVAQVLRPTEQWLVGGSVLSRDGVMRIPVRLGLAAAATQRMRHANVDFPYEIVEVT